MQSNCLMILSNHSKHDSILGDLNAGMLKLPSCMQSWEINFAVTLVCCCSKCSVCVHWRKKTLRLLTGSQTLQLMIFVITRGRYETMYPCIPHPIMGRALAIQGIFDIHQQLCMKRNEEKRLMCQFVLMVLYYITFIVVFNLYLFV